MLASVLVMTIEQREYKLNKRIAIFEQKLNVHCALLSMSCPTIIGIEKVITGIYREVPNYKPL